MKILIPKVVKGFEDMVYPYLAFCYKMKYQKREWTGYKELRALELDAEWLEMLGIIFPSQSGGYRFIEENIINLVNIYRKGKAEEYESSDAMWEDVIPLDYSKKEVYDLDDLKNKTNVLITRDKVYLTATKPKMNDVIISLSDTSEEGSSTAHTNGK